MELRVLQYFLTVAREENITKAAETLHITQPTLSRQLAQLEEETGVQLFRRGSGARRITLTTEGILLRRRAEELMELEEKTRKELISQKDDLSGTIAIGCGEIAGAGWLADSIQSFRVKHPQVKFEILTAANNEILEKIEDGLLDFGLLLGQPASGSYAYLDLKVEERWILLIRPDDALAQKQEIHPDDLKGVRLILPQGSNKSSPIIRWLGSDRPLKNAVTCNLTANAAVLVSRGLGAAPVIDGAVSFDENQIISRPLSPALTTSAVLAWKKDQPVCKAAEAFLAHSSKE